MIYPILVPLAGLEPARYFYRGILSPLRLPIPPQRRVYFFIEYSKAWLGRRIFFIEYSKAWLGRRIFFIEYSKVWLGRRVLFVECSKAWLGRRI